MSKKKPTTAESILAFFQNARNMVARDTKSRDKETERYITKLLWARKGNLLQPNTDLETLEREIIARRDSDPTKKERSIFIALAQRITFSALGKTKGNEKKINVRFINAHVKSLIEQATNKEKITLDVGITATQTELKRNAEILKLLIPKSSL